MTIISPPEEAEKLAQRILNKGGYATASTDACDLARAYLAHKAPRLTDHEILAVDNLRTCQDQLDADGCMVGVSRQAVEETLAALDRLTQGAAAETLQVDSCPPRESGTGVGIMSLPPVEAAPARVTLTDHERAQLAAARANHVARYTPGPIDRRNLLAIIDRLLGEPRT